MRRLIFIFLLPFSLLKVQAEDTLSLSLKQADSIFVSNNLMLLASRYKVDAAKAMIKQAKLWANPSLSTEWNFYNPDKDKFFDIGKEGQKIFALEQVVSIAGKRNKQIQLAKENAQFSELEFYELMRALKVELHRSYFVAYYNRLTIKKLDNQIVLMKAVIDAMETQSSKGNIPLKEVLRLKALFYDVNLNRAELITDEIEALQTIQTLLQLHQPIKIVPNVLELNKYALNKIELQDLMNKALVNRPDLKMFENLSKQADLNVSLQKSLSIPDLRIGGVYDQAGSYINNYTGLSLGFDLPVFNRNQGNVKYAKAISNQYKAELKNKNNEVSKEVMFTYQKLLSVEESYQMVDSAFTSGIEVLNEGYFTNFQKRNISMMDSNL
jgi:cobalt-zinc-cadmium efflux system outer membrane protein